MKLQLTKRGDYAVRATLFLARNHSAGELHTAQLISEAMHIPRGFLPQVFGDLVRAGLVRAYQGKQGGYKLHKEPSEITLLEVIESVEGPTFADRCVLRDIGCNPQNPCAVHATWSRAQKSLVDVLSQAYLSDLVANKDLLGRD